MARRDIVVVGASAGGVQALTALVRGLPLDLGAALLVVLHLPAKCKSALPQILSSAGLLPARHGRNGEAIHRNRIYVARPDHHLLVHDGHLRVVRGPRENGHRPGIDPLFRTAAESFGPRVIGVVLSGALYDGTAGLVSIKSQGGLAVVQDPSDAMVDAMPRSALENVDTDYVVPAGRMGKLLQQLVSRSEFRFEERAGRADSHARTPGGALRVGASRIHDVDWAG